MNIFKKYWTRSKKIEHGQNIFELGDGIGISNLPDCSKEFTTRLYIQISQKNLNALILIKSFFFTEFTSSTRNNDKFFNSEEVDRLVEEKSGGLLFIFYFFIYFYLFFTFQVCLGHLQFQGMVQQFWSHHFNPQVRPQWNDTILWGWEGKHGIIPHASRKVDSNSPCPDLAGVVSISFYHNCWTISGELGWTLRVTSGKLSQCLPFILNGFRFLLQCEKIHGNAMALRVSL